MPYSSSSLDALHVVIVRLRKKSNCSRSMVEFDTKSIECNECILGKIACHRLTRSFSSSQV